MTKVRAAILSIFAAITAASFHAKAGYREDATPEVLRKYFARNYNGRLTFLAIGSRDVSVYVEPAFVETFKSAAGDLFRGAAVNVKFVRELVAADIVVADIYANDSSPFSQWADANSLNVPENDGCTSSSSTNGMRFSKIAINIGAAREWAARCLRQTSLVYLGVYYAKTKEVTEFTSRNPALFNRAACLANTAAFNGVDFEDYSELRRQVEAGQLRCARE